jgi:predicted CXXCH cytochrome family protein
VLIQVDEQDLCITCHPFEPEFTQVQKHPPAYERFCLDCHNPHASDYKGIIQTNQRDLCFRCHPSVAQLAVLSVQHNPFIYGNCTGCHEPHSGPETTLLIENQPPLCYNCHPGVQNDFNRPSTHPVGTLELNCADCHNPHAASVNYLLIAQNNELCFTCHTNYPQQALYDESAHWENRLLCIDCHAAHGASYEPILREENPQLCLNCHGWVRSHGNQHPVTPAYYDSRAQTGLTCSSTCHDPHGTVYNYMIQDFYFPQDGQCLQCHTRVGIDF